jgi:hypothetical protein
MRFPGAVGLVAVRKAMVVDLAREGKVEIDPAPSRHLTR